MDDYKLKKKSYTGRISVSKKSLKRYTVKLTLGTVAICMGAFLVTSNIHNSHKENEYIENAFSSDTNNGFDELSDVFGVSFNSKYTKIADNYMPYFSLVSDYEKVKDEDQKNAIYDELHAGFSDINDNSLDLLKAKVGDVTHTDPHNIKVISDKDIPLDIIIGNGKSYHSYGDVDSLATSIVDLQTAYHNGNHDSYVKSVKKVLLDSAKVAEGKEEEKGNAKK